jgi:hypothetical protein
MNALYVATEPPYGGVLHLGSAAAANETDADSAIAAVIIFSGPVTLVSFYRVEQDASHEVAHAHADRAKLRPTQIVSAVAAPGKVRPLVIPRVAGISRTDLALDA